MKNKNKTRTLMEIIDALDEMNDSYEDIYHEIIHSLTEKDGNRTVKEVLLEYLDKWAPGRDNGNDDDEECFC
jgi:uncharacterized protein YllA (UPF0747 family)